jgi:hypothetical protein
VLVSQSLVLWCWCPSSLVLVSQSLVLVLVSQSLVLVLVLGVRSLVLVSPSLVVVPQSLVSEALVPSTRCSRRMRGLRPPQPGNPVYTATHASNTPKVAIDLFKRTSRRFSA